MASNMKAAREDVMRFAEAAENGDAETIRGMLKVHTDNHQATQELIESRGLNGKNPLHLAVEQHHSAVVDVLLEVCALAVLSV
jgi:ankyrin repeat protein